MGRTGRGRRDKEFRPFWVGLGEGEETRSLDHSCRLGLLTFSSDHSCRLGLLTFSSRVGQTQIVQVPW